MNTTAPDTAAILKKYFPIKLASGYEIRSATREECFACVKEHARTIFGPSSNRYILASESRTDANRGMHALRRETHSEHFLFVDPSGTPVGWNMSESEDWLTFYLRNTGILPAHQNKGLYSAFQDAIFKFCTEVGYERITSHHKGTNRGMLILKLRANYFLSGFELTERWGPMFKAVKLLHEDRRKNFVENFGEANHL